MNVRYEQLVEGTSKIKRRGDQQDVQRLIKGRIEVSGEHLKEVIEGIVT